MTDAPSLQIVLEENRRMAEEMKQLKQMLAGKKGAKKNGFDEVKKEMGGEVRENEKKTEEDRKHAGGQVPHKVEVKKEKAGGKSANSQGSVYRPLEDGGGRKLADCYPDLDSFFSAPPPKRGWYDNGYKATSRSIFPRGMGPKIDRAHVFSPAELAILGLPPGSNKSNLLNPSYRGYDPKIAAAIRKLKVTGREPTQVGHNNKNSGSSSNNNIQRPLPNIKSPENPLIAMSIPNTSSPHSPRSPRTPSDPALMTFGYNPTFNQKKPPFGYICKICKIPGHYVQACPRIATDMASYGPSVNGAPVSSGNDPNGNNSNMGRYRPSSSEMLNGPGMNGPGPIGLNGGGQSRPPNRILNPNYGGGGARGIPYQNNAQNTHGDYDRGARGEKAIGERITKDEEYKKSHMLMVFSIGINFHGDNRDVTNLGPREKEELVKRMLIEMLTYCDVAITRVIVNTNRGGNNIFAFIHCLDESEANKCIRKCFGMNFGGRRFLCKYQQPRFEDDWGSKHVPNWDDVINRKEIEAGRFAKRLRKEEREASRRVKSPTNSTGVQSTRKSSPKRVDGMTESQRRKLEAFLDKLYPDRHKVKEEKEEKEVEEEAEEIEKVEEIENVEEIEKTEEEEKGAKGKRKAAASARAKKNNNKKKAKPIMASMVVIDSEEDDDEERRPRSPKIGQRVKHLIRGWGIVASGVRKGGWVDFEFDDSSTLKALRMSDRNLVFDEEEKEEEEKEKEEEKEEEVKEEEEVEVKEEVKEEVEQDVEQDEKEKETGDNVKEDGGNAESPPPVPKAARRRSTVPVVPPMIDSPPPPKPEKEEEEEDEDEDEDEAGEVEEKNAEDIIEEGEVVELNDKELTDIFSTIDRGVEKGQLNPMLFGTLIRTVTGNKNLYEEMKYFQTFNTSGDGVIDLDEWLEGVKKIKEKQGGMKTVFYRGLVKYHLSNSCIL
mmetsp:Transcript_1823/g.3606  ORF Transcript_1823/g.3606 Transcript_1823/m.3606 type:complete len:940 (-) Transcript_1823:58-2877(-)